MPRRLCILVDAYLDLFTAKTAVGLLRHCPDEVVAVISRPNAGKKLEELVGAGKGVPIVASIEDALPLRPDHLVLGVAMPGGHVPPEWRAMMLTALRSGMDILNGLHERLNDDAELAAAAKSAGRKIIDVRVPPPIKDVGLMRARGTKGRRILTVGTDCNLGKRVTALELTRALKARGRRAEFVPTGQTGVMIAGWGMAIDAVISDFVSGAVEQMVLTKADAELILIEGQGSILHPSFSGVTLSLIHGAMPDAMILCHAPLRRTLRHTDVPFPPLNHWVHLHESLMAPLHPSRVIGVALNTFGMEDAAARAAVAEAAQVTGLPATDVIRFGVDPLVAAIEGL